MVLVDGLELVVERLSINAVREGQATFDIGVTEEHFAEHRYHRDDVVAHEFSKPPNARSEPAHAGGTLNHDKPSFAWAVGCSKSFADLTPNVTFTPSLTVSAGPRNRFAAAARFADLWCSSFIYRAGATQEIPRQRWSAQIVRLAAYSGLAA